MDLLLLDIRNFLKKLECGQMELEAGQWELHKDMVKVTETFDVLKDLKVDMKEVRMSHQEQMCIIKALEAKLNNFSTRLRHDKKRPQIQTSSPNKSRRPAGKHWNNYSKGLKKQKRRPHCSEVLEVIPNINLVETKKVNLDAESGTESLNCEHCLESLSTSSSKFHKRHPDQNQPVGHSKRVDDEILQRYLMDSARYREASGCSWNQKLLQKSIPEGERPSDPLTETRPKYSNSKAVLKRAKPGRKIEVGVCRKSLGGLRSVRRLEAAHKKTSTKVSRSFKCCYCNKDCKRPRALTAHMRKCTLLLKRKPKLRS